MQSTNTIEAAQELKEFLDRHPDINVRMGTQRVLQDVRTAMDAVAKRYVGDVMDNSTIFHFKHTVSEALENLMLNRKIASYCVTDSHSPTSSNSDTITVTIMPIKTVELIVLDMQFAR